MKKEQQKGFGALGEKHEKAFNGQCLLLEKKLLSSGQVWQKVAGYRPGLEQKREISSQLLGEKERDAER
jgi:hypothetical protein